MGSMQSVLNAHEFDIEAHLTLLSLGRIKNFISAEEEQRRRKRRESSGGKKITFSSQRSLRLCSSSALMKF
jgi:hypothetical protein